MPEFVELAQWFAAPPEPVPQTPDLEEEEVLIEVDEEPDAFDAIEGALTDARMFRAALSEAIELRAAEIVHEIAVEVLARELELRPCDLATVVRRASARYNMDEVLNVRVHPDDAPALSGIESVISDDSLRRGDVILAARCGSVDARLGVRLERVLRAMR